MLSFKGEGTGAAGGAAGAVPPSAVDEEYDPFADQIDFADLLNGGSGGGAAERHLSGSKRPLEAGGSGGGGGAGSSSAGDVGGPYGQSLVRDSSLKEAAASVRLGDDAVIAKEKVIAAMSKVRAIVKEVKAADPTL